MKDLYSYLVNNNPPNSIYTFSSKKLFWDWRQEIKQHKTVSLKAAILIFVGFDGTVLHIGSTELIKTYLRVIRSLDGKHVNTIYIVLEQQINLIAKTKEYRKLFLPKKNTYVGNGRFIAQEDENCLIIPIKKKPVVDWVLANPSAPFDDFMCVFRNASAVISSLCTVFNCEDHNLSELQHAIKNNKKVIKYL
jgi:hypothetical protein